MNRAQFLSCKQQIANVAALVRELPLTEYLVELSNEPGNSVEHRSLVAALQFVQQVLAPVSSKIYRGS